MAVIETWLKQDLKKPVQVKELGGHLFSADNMANLIGVEVFSDGNPVNLVDGVTAYVIRDDGYTVAVNGTVSGNRASIVLPETCYTVVGPISIVLKNGRTTIGACRGYVYQSSTDAIVDPGHLIPSLDELLAQIENCRTATASANSAASSANSAASNANSKAAAANTAAENANTKAGLANTAANTANAAATKIDGMTVSASGLPTGSAPTASVSEVSGHKHIAFGIPKGDKGKDFHIAHTFSSIAEMNAYSGPKELYDYAMIDTGNVQDADTGKLYCYESDNAWHYIGDLSGAQGIKGETGTGIDHVTLNADYTLTIYFDDSTSYTTGSIRGATGITPNMTIGTVSTLNPGQSATASITGTPEQPVLNLGIPKGDTGSIENLYATQIPVSESDSRNVKQVLDSKLESVPVMGGATASDPGASGLVPAPAAGDQDKFLKANGSWANVPNPQVMTGATATDPGSSGLTPAPAAGDNAKYLRGDATFSVPGVMTINGRTPDPVTGDITVIEGGGSGSYGSYRLDATIPVSAWTGSGPYTATITNQYIKSTMDGRSWLDNPSAKLGETTYTSTDGALIVSTTVKPTAEWGLHVSLALNGADVLADMSASIANVADGLAILATGDAHAAITSGQFVYVRNHGTADGFSGNAVLSDGLYVASAAVNTNGALTTSNLTADGSGGLNALKSKIGNVGSTDLQSQVTTLNSKLTYKVVSDYNNFAPSGTVVTRRYGFSVSGNAANAPVSGDNITYRGYSEGVASYYTQHFTIEYATSTHNRGKTFIRTCIEGVFGPWREIPIADRLTTIQSNASVNFSLILYGRAIVTIIGYSTTTSGRCFAIRTGESTYLIKWLGEAPSQISITMNASGTFTVTNSGEAVTFLQVEYPM